MIDVNKHIKALNSELYPTGRVWNYTRGSERLGSGVSTFIDGLGNPFTDGLGNPFITGGGQETSLSKRLNSALLKSYERYYTDSLSLLNQLLADNTSFDETDAANWERIYGLSATGLTIEQRRANILRRQSYPNGVIERGSAQFIQEQLQAVGFTVYVTENRFANGANFEVQQPSLPYTLCVNYIDESLEAPLSAVGAQFGTFEMGVDEMGAGERVPEEALRATFFIGGASYPSAVDVPLNRKNEFRQLILKLKPAHTACFLYVNYI